MSVPVLFVAGLWPLAAMAVGVVLAFHYLFAPRSTNAPSCNRDVSLAPRYAINIRLFPKLVEIILRFTGRGITKLAKCFGAFGFCTIEKMLEDFGLTLFCFFLRHFNPRVYDVLRSIPSYDEHLAQQAELARQESNQVVSSPSTLKTDTGTGCKPASETGGGA
jgi:hypothetical protein